MNLFSYHARCKCTTGACTYPADMAAEYNSSDDEDMDHELTHANVTIARLSRGKGAKGGQEHRDELGGESGAEEEGVSNNWKDIMKQALESVNHLQARLEAVLGAILGRALCL